jgi:phage tail sheath protein FI
MSNLAFANLTRPGVFITETTGGYRVPEIASFSTVYMIGSSEEGDYNFPTLVNNVEDFTNQFGASASTNSVKLYFRNDRQGKLYFIRTAIAPVFEVTVGSPTTQVVTITINGEAVDTNIVVGDTPTQAVAKFIASISSSDIGDEVVATSTAPNKFIIRSSDPEESLTVAATNALLTIANITPASLPNSYDYVYAIEKTFDTIGGRNLEQGFIIAPEAFQNLSTSVARQAVGVAMENLAADKDYDWVALVDCAPNQNTVAAVQAEGQLYATAQGHLAFYAPYLTDLEGNTVPSSAAIAGIATKRYRQQGFQEPPAGANYPIAGVINVTKRFTNTEQSVLNPLGINLVRFLLNIGVVSWAARTRSSNSYYTFVHTRVIMNVLNGTLRGAFDYDIFSTIDGFSILFQRIEGTANSVCRRLWLGKALFGATEADAYAVKCSLENNQLDDLENGNVLLEVYAAPSPILEKLLVNTIRVNLGAVQDAAAAGQVSN